jgi:hypothetical protein
MAFHAANVSSRFIVSMKPGFWEGVVVVVAVSEFSNDVDVEAGRESNGACSRVDSDLIPDCEPASRPMPVAPKAINATITRCCLMRVKTDLNIWYLRHSSSHSYCGNK